MKNVLRIEDSDIKIISGFDLIKDTCYLKLFYSGVTITSQDKNNVGIPLKVEDGKLVSDDGIGILKERYGEGDYSFTEFNGDYYFVSKN